MGPDYSREFSKWMKAHGFDRMLKSTRSVAIELFTKTPILSKRRERHCRNGNASGLFIRCQMSDAGERHLITATVNALPI
jgi:hypothetical protein